jgi:hypothetical protein
MAGVSIDARLGQVADWVDRDLRRLLVLMLTRWRDEVPEYFHPDDPEFLAIADASIVHNLRAVANGLRSGRATPNPLPTGAVEEALVAAREGIAWATVDRTYRIGHAIFWEELIEEVETWDLDRGERTDLLRVVSRFVFAYIDFVSAQLGQVHEEELVRHTRLREQRVATWVRDLLAGLPVAADGTDYDLRREHLGVIAWGPDAAATIAGFARQLDATALVVSGHGESLWAWLGGLPRLPDAWRTLGRFAVAGDTSVALGAPAAGADGFRATHRQAQEAARVGRLHPGRTVHYGDVGLEALLLRDERAARTYAEEELGPLLDADDRSRILLETLTAYVGAGWVAASTAALLGVHERTIAYRLATIEKRLGHPLTQRRPEIGAALRIVAVLRTAP